MDGVPDGYLGLDELYKRLVDHFDNQAGVPPAPDAADEFDAWYGQYGMANAENSDKATEIIRTTAATTEFSVLINHPQTVERFRVDREYWTEEMAGLSVTTGKIFALNDRYGAMDNRRAFVSRNDAEEWFSALFLVAHDISVPDPNYRTFGQIAAFWACETETFPFKYHLDRPLAADNADKAEAAMLDELTRAIQGGKFVRNGASVLLIEAQPGACVSFGCEDLAEAGRGGFRFNDYVKEAYERRPWKFIPEYGISRILIGQDDFANWCEDRGWALPRFWFGDSTDSRAKNRPAISPPPDDVKSHDGHSPHKWGEYERWEELSTNYEKEGCSKTEAATLVREDLSLLSIEPSHIARMVRRVRAERKSGKQPA